MLLEIAPSWVAPVVAVVVFVGTTAVGFILMRIAFNMRPGLSGFTRRQRRRRDPGAEEQPAPAEREA